MIISPPFKYHAMQEQRNEIVEWLITNSGPLRRSDTSPRGTIWYAGPRWLVALASGHGAYHIHYKVIIWDSELAVQFALLYGNSGYSGSSRIDDSVEIEVFDEAYDDRSKWARSILHSL